MESPAPSNSSSSTPASGPERHSPPPRNSIEDADSSVTRKRPRLDSGERAHQNIISPFFAPSHELTGEGKVPLKPVPSPSTSKEVDMSPGAPSKVTLNLRDGSPRKHNRSHVSTKAGDEQRTIGGISSQRVPVSELSNQTVQTDGTESVQQSNVLIEVAEPEDMDAPPHQTVWNTVEGGDWRAWQREHVASFPMLIDLQHWEQHMEELVEEAMQDPRRLQKILTKVAEWINKYLLHTQGICDLWPQLALDNLEFWSAFPAILGILAGNGLAASTRHATAELVAAPAHLNDFLSSFISLAARMVAIDRIILDMTKSDDSTELNLISTTYCHAIRRFLPSKPYDVGVAALEHVGIDLSQQILHLTCGSKSQGAFLKQLVATLPKLLSRSNAEGSLNQLLKNTLVMPGEVLSLYSAQCQQQQKFVSMHVEQSFREYFQTIDRTVRYAIGKQSPILSGDLLFNAILTELRAFISQSTPVVGLLLHKEGLAESQDALNLSEDDRTDLAETLWRLDVYEKCVREGRMEIRITGLDLLQSALIEVYNRYIQSRSSSNPQHAIVEAVSDRLLKNKLVEYLLSVESHPQIISRSANVVGFLAVSGHWTDEQSDSIWQTVQQMEDLRACETILDMLPAVTKYLGCKDLSHIIENMQATPISRFDAKFQHFLLVVCSQFAEKATNPEEALIIPVRAFMVLLRSASADPGLSLSRKHEIWSTVQQGFRNMGPAEWPSAARLQIYHDCFRDLKSRSLGTSGSCAILRQLLERYTSQDIAEVCCDLDATTLIASDFSRLGELKLATNTNFEEYMAPVEDRLRVLEAVILRLPETFSVELTARLWTCMLARDAASQRAREAAWDMLARVANDSSTLNTFLEQCVREHLPSLDPMYYSRSTLFFAHCLRDYERRTMLEPQRSPNNLIPFGTTAELYWQLALTAEDDYISTKASEALIEVAREQSRATTSPQQELVLIDKCINQAIDIGSELQQAHQGHERSVEMNTLQMRILRVFSMLSHFFAAVQDTCPTSPSNRSESQAGQDSSEEERLAIQYVTSDRGNSSVTKTIEIGGQQTLGDLLVRLRARTGFTKFNVITGGRRLDLERDAASTLSALGLHQKGVLILHRIPGSLTLKRNLSRIAIQPVEDIVFRHFDRLYALLDANTSVADQILQLLRLFAPHEEVTRLVSSWESGRQLMLPLQFPHKASYTLYAIVSKQRALLDEGIIDHGFMSKSVLIMTEALFALELPLSAAKTRKAYWLPTEILGTLLLFLKEPVPAKVSAAYLVQPAAFVAKLFEISDVEYVVGEQDAVIFCQSCFGVLLEASRLNELAWKAFSTDGHSPALLRRLILLNPSQRDRFATSQMVCSVLTTLSGNDDKSLVLEKDLTVPRIPSQSSQAAAFVDLFWDMTCDMIPIAMTEQPANSQQLFGLALTLFNALDDGSVDVLKLQDYLKLWNRMLLAYKPHQDVSRDTVDCALKGLGDLINQVLLILNRKGVISQVGASFRQQLFDNLLFPQIRDVGERGKKRDVSAPVLGSQTRCSLYNLACRSANDASDLQDLFRLLNKVINQPWSVLGSFSYDRLRQMRATAGYPGLDNLSNTCYLNSLMTQLFMNPRFREFILQCEVVDGRSQALLAAIQQLFASVQDGWQRSVSTRELADAIETYEGPLDPTLQMDADEAFNLLFDRLEGQLAKDEDKALFKKLFGGQIIQQIKSKECSHVSERFEAVTAIQCDIQGKRNLAQSLQAYIEGEVMEGDNKYKCSQCDRYVNAVKRACLKDVPDNLIFHLKRFDFDLMTGTRSKVNDYFMFPETVDMAPYTVGYLDRGRKTIDPDPFVLVGILVHNGNAELGHYYSYIRERPINLQSWIEFNDSDVSQFDFGTLADQCFGGPPENAYNQASSKSWNAYMLFYQRQSSILADRQRFDQSPEQMHLKVPIHHNVAAQVAAENEALARTFCLSGPEHSQFVKDLLVAVLRGRGNTCSSEHYLEDAAIHCALAHIEKVFGRELRRSGVVPTLDFLKTMAANCTRCCETILRWTAGQDTSRLRSLLLRLPDPALRSRVGNLLVQALRALKTETPRVYGNLTDAYGNSEVEMSGDDSIGNNGGLFALLVRRLYSLLDVAPLNFKAWPELFRLLHDLGSFGSAERAFLHRLGFLQHSLEVLLIDRGHDWENRCHGKHTAYLRLVGKRAYNLTNLLSFIVLLLEGLQVEIDANMTADHSQNNKPRMTNAERSLLTIKAMPDGGERRIPWILERAANVSEFIAERQSLEALTRFILRNNSSLALESSIVDIIGHGVVKSPAELAAPYLSIALAFLAHSTSLTLMEQVAQAVADGTKTLGDSGGAEHLEFFRRCVFLRNQDAFPEQARPFLLTIILLCHEWGPALLEYPDGDVTLRCNQLLDRILFQLPDQNDDGEIVDVASAAITRVRDILVSLVEKYVHQNRALDESRKPLVMFAERCLVRQSSGSGRPHGTPADLTPHQRSFFNRALELITPADDAGSNAFESDEPTDASSTLVVNGTVADDPTDLN